MHDIAKRAKDFVKPLHGLSYEEKKKYVRRVLIDLIDTHPDNEGLYRFVYAVQKELLGSFSERVLYRLGNEQLNKQLITCFFAFFMLFYPGLTNTGKL